MTLKAKALGQSIVLIESETRYMLCSTFMRLQEFYESPFNSIRGNYFDEEDFMDCYANANGNIFSYFEDWGGFNVPGHVIEKFKVAFAGQLNKKEVRLLSMIDALVIPSQPYYVIGAEKEDWVTVRHEIAHALYGLMPEYEQAMDYLLKSEGVNMVEFKKALTKMGYCDDAVLDEAQAYLATGSNHELKDFGVPGLTKQKKKFVTLFEQFVEEFNLG